MSSDVVLTAAMRSNLLSLQTTQSKIDDTQYRLATGRKVNSALDNPQSFFAAKSLTNRASDLSALLDGMGQSIQTIKQADTAVASLEGLLGQADAIATEARSAVDTGGAQATITGNVSFNGDTEITNYTNISNGDEIAFSFTDENGKAISVDTNYDDATAGAASSISFDQYETVDEVITQINAMKETTTGEQLMEASLDDNGQLQIKSLMGGDMRMVFSTSSLADALGFGDYGAKELNQVVGFTPNQYAITVSKTPNINSYTLYKSDGTEADRSSLLSDLFYKNSSGTLTAVDTGTFAANDDLLIGVNGDTMTTSNEVISDTLNTATVQDLIDGINNNSAIKDNVEASFNETTNQIELRALTESTKSIQFAIGDEAGAASTGIDLGFGMTALATNGVDDTDYDSESIAFGVGAGQLAQLESDYNTILTQIDDLVADSSYRGTNLLTGDTLVTYFNADQSSSLSTVGADLTTGTSGLNIKSANFSSLSNIASSISEVSSATDVVRNFSSSLANSLSVIQNREDFTSQTINTLTEGADKLTVADQNEEGAKLLALQTRQQLGVTSLSLASQSQQSVLRLF